MIIRPFVENSIKQGMAKSTTRNLLCISFRLEDNILKIRILDNGKGIRPGAESRCKGKPHQSRGIKNTTERILYFTQSYNGHLEHHYGVKISNRGRKGRSRGVLVEINLPVIE